MTTLAFATDIHHDGRVFPWLQRATSAYDVVAIGGDLDDPCAGLPGLKLNHVMHKLKPNSVRDKIFEFSAKGPRRRVLVVLGNHDNPDPRALHGTSVDVDGLVIGGVGGSLPTGRFPFQLEEGDYESILDRLGRVDVLIVHQPPLGTKCDISHAGEHAGSQAVRKYVLREQPMLVLTGHVHESPAVDRLSSTTIVNPGPFFEGKYAEVELLSEGVGTKIKRVAPLIAQAHAHLPSR